MIKKFAAAAALMAGLTACSESAMAPSEADLAGGASFSRGVLPNGAKWGDDSFFALTATENQLGLTFRIQGAGNAQKNVIVYGDVNAIVNVECTKTVRNGRNRELRTMTRDRDQRIRGEGSFTADRNGWVINTVWIDRWNGNQEALEFCRGEGWETGEVKSIRAAKGLGTYLEVPGSQLSGEGRYKFDNFGDVIVNISLN